jgi:bifunctional non-homologous end joining protein LigD
LKIFAFSSLTFASYLVSVRQTSVLPPASFRFHLAMDTLAVQLAVPLAGPAWDFNPQESAPCRAHEKKDGRRLLIRKSGAEIHGINRRGLETGLPETIIQSIHKLPGDFVIDGEAVGDTYHAFDILDLWKAPTTAKPYRERLPLLKALVDFAEVAAVQVIETVFEPDDKAALLGRLRQNRAEGAVFKQVEAPYTPGRPNSGGTQLKYKFYSTGSFIVSAINDRRSVSLCLHPDYAPCGNVAIPPSHRVPRVGAVVEVRYLHAFPESLCLFQPVYLGQRTDLEEQECTAEQLKFKANNDRDAEE